MRKKITEINRKIIINTLPWFKFWTGNFRSKTDPYSNAEVGAYIRLLASYWDNDGLPSGEKALTRIAKIEPGDDVDLGTLLGEFFELKDGSFRHEYMDALRVEAIGEIDANRLRTASARAKLAKQRRSMTVPVTETEVEPVTEREVEVDVDIEVEREEDPELEADLQADERFKNQTNTQTEDPDGNSETNVNANSLPPAGDFLPPAGDFLPPGGDCLPAGDSGEQTTVQRATGRYQQSASRKPDGVAQGAAVPAASSAQSGITFLLQDGRSIPLSSQIDESQLSATQVSNLRQLATRFHSFSGTRVTADELPTVIRQWIQPSWEAA